VAVPLRFDSPQAYQTGPHALGPEQVTRLRDGVGLAGPQTLVRRGKRLSPAPTWRLMNAPLVPFARVGVGATGDEDPLDARGVRALGLPLSEGIPAAV
jgi:hypothetical protein